MATNILIHIGPPKTGSTLIQGFLARSERELLRQGVLFPRAGRLQPGEGVWVNRAGKRSWVSGQIDNHLLLGYVLLQQVEGVHSETYWKPLLAEMRRSNARLIVLSAEVFANLSKEQVGRMAEYLKEFSVSVVMYLRDPYKRTLSQYTQSVKAGRYSGSFESFIEKSHSLNSGHYQATLDRWRSSFATYVDIRAFDQVINSPGLERDFLSLLSVNPNDFFPYLSAQPANASPPNQAIRVLRTINRLEQTLGSQTVLQRPFGHLRAIVSRVVRHDRRDPLNRLLKRWLGKPLSTDSDRQRIDALAGDSYRSLLCHHGRKHEAAISTKSLSVAKNLGKSEGCML